MRVDELIPADDPLSAHRVALAGSVASPPVRWAFAATRVVLQDRYAQVAHSPESPGSADEVAESIDWPATRAARQRLDALGFGVAEAMDTAQRFQIGWPLARRLIEETGRLNLEHTFIAGAGVDHLESVGGESQLVDGVLAQIDVIRGAGGIAIVLPLLWLAEQRADEECYVRVYDSIARSAGGPLLLHWLGAMFHPGLQGYFPGRSVERILAARREAWVGVKLSLLDEALEVRLRRALAPMGQTILTGDDLHFASLIEGADSTVVETRDLGGQPLTCGDFSHALLGVFDGVAEPAALALRALAAGDHQRYRALMQPCEAFGQHVFSAPVHAYKAGLAFRAWLSGEQSNAMLVHHAERLRARPHFTEVARLAAAAGALADRAGARERLAVWLKSRAS